MDNAEIVCNPHPQAPHGFSRNSSHTAGRYVCDCEGWQPDEYNDGFVDTLYPETDGE